MIDEDPASAGLIFGGSVDPLPFIDPTAAAERLGLKRHTLACYRSLGEGPSYYEFGRAIRYTNADLEAWRAQSTAVCPLPRLTSKTSLLIETIAAARFLGISTDYLRYHRVVGGGPPFRRYARHVYYMVGDLVAWVDSRRRRPPSQSIDTQFLGG